MEIREAGFELLPWLQHNAVESHLDESDPLRRGISASFTSPGSDFEKTMGGRTSRDYREHRLPDGSLVAMWEVWSDYEEDERGRIAFASSNGDRLWSRIDILIEYLNQSGYDLLIEVQITRNRNSSHRRGGEKYEPGRSCIYLLRRDGSLETVAECRSFGRTDRKGARVD